MISQIYLLAHPLYHQSYTFMGPNYPRTAPATKAEKTVTKNELHHYGLFIQEAKEHPNSLFVFVELENVHWEAPFAKEYARLKRYAKRELEGRIICLPAAFGYGKKHYTRHVEEAITESREALREFSFAKKVEITYAGQWEDHCARRSAERISQILDGRKVQSYIAAARTAKTELERETHFIAAERTRRGRLTEFSKWRRRMFGKRFSAPKKRRNKP